MSNDGRNIDTDLLNTKRSDVLGMIREAKTMSTSDPAHNWGAMIERWERLLQKIEVRLLARMHGEYNPFSR